MITTIDRASLARVVGGAGEGPNSERVTDKNGNATETRRSDYGYCVDDVGRSCDALNTHWLWGLDRKGAAACRAASVPKQCGLPKAD